MSNPLVPAVEQALSDLECADLQCWCFTRAAMKRPPCECANCQVWRSLATAIDSLPVGDQKYPCDMCNLALVRTEGFICRICAEARGNVDSKVDHSAPDRRSP